MRIISFVFLFLVACVGVISCNLINLNYNKPIFSYSLSIQLQGGKLDEDTGCVSVATSIREDYMCYYHTPKYIQAQAIENVSVDENEELYIFCYDKKYKFLQYTNNIQDLPKRTYWIKIQTSKEVEYTTSKILKCSILSSSSTYTESYNIAQNKSNIRHFSFEVNLKETNVTKRHYDNGFIYLPPNYEPDGDPVPLVIFWHGTGGYNFKDKDAISYESYLKFITLNGYAVADCSGMTDRYQIGENAVAGYDCRMTPLALDCFTELYYYIINNYNISKDGAHVFGKSNGGLGTVMLGYTEPFPIKSLASLAGSLSLVASFRYSTAINLNYWLSQFGLDCNYDYTYYWYNKHTDSDIDFIAENSFLFSDYDPMIKGTNIEPSSFTRLIMENGYIGHTMNNTELLKLISETSKYLPKPMKIWHAIDDVSVPIETSIFFKKMVDNGSGICYLQEIPAGHGGHHAVDNSELASKTIYKTRYGGTMTIPTAYAELVDWFNQW